MITKIQFFSDEEMKNIIESQRDKYLVCISYLKDGNYLTFSSEKPIDGELELNCIKDKIDILEAEKEKLLEITKEQDKLLVDNTYKISMLEMNLGGM